MGQHELAAGKGERQKVESTTLLPSLASFNCSFNCCAMTSECHVHVSVTQIEMRKYIIHSISKVEDAARSLQVQHLVKVQSWARKSLHGRRTNACSVCNRVSQNPTRRLPQPTINPSRNAVPSQTRVPNHPMILSFYRFLYPIPFTRMSVSP